MLNFKRIQTDVNCINITLNDKCWNDCLRKMNEDTLTIHFSFIMLVSSSRYCKGRRFCGRWKQTTVVCQRVYGVREAITGRHQVTKSSAVKFGLWRQDTNGNHRAAFVGMGENKGKVFGKTHRKTEEFQENPLEPFQRRHVFCYAHIRAKTQRFNRKTFTSFFQFCFKWRRSN